MDNNYISNNTEQSSIELTQPTNSTESNNIDEEQYLYLKKLNQKLAAFDEINKEPKNEEPTIKR